MITVGDLSAKDENERQEVLSRLWAQVYVLRAEILRVERLKQWPYDPTEPRLSDDALGKATVTRGDAVRAMQVEIEGYIERYGESIQHGEGEFHARALLRLGGWAGDANCSG